MNILLASSEIFPFAKTGGLADVCGSLPVELSRLGHRPWLFMPAYRCVYHTGQHIEPIGVDLSIPVGSKIVQGSLAKSHLPGSDVEVFLVQQPEYFDRAALYGEHGHDYSDNCERFVFFCRAVMESIRAMSLHVDVLHCNDWQTGLLPALLQLEYRHASGYAHIKSLLTIHNMAYQGSFWHWDMLLTGLDWRYFNWKQMECFGRLNLLKTGLVFADHLSTVSPTYAEEIRTSDLGCGLQGVLDERREVLHGIINGIDDSIWNPATDPYLAANYGPEDWISAKPKCRTALRAELGLPDVPVPMVGLVGRLASQKGWDLILEAMRARVPTTDLQWAILGTGDPAYHDALQGLAEAFPQRVAVVLGFSDELAHRIEAGADLFLMPSRYEPCGLNQLYSLKYGTVPIVHATGGLADTIVDLTDATQAAGTANGFAFRHYDAPTLIETLDRALQVYTQAPQTWAGLVSRGMSEDWSWRASAHAYVDLYRTMQGG